jgi:hypothetical protein
MATMSVSAASMAALRKLLMGSKERISSTSTGSGAVTPVLWYRAADGDNADESCGWQ